MNIEQIPGFNRERLETICVKWGIKELSVFGSVNTDKFTAESDIDILIDFNQGVSIGYLRYYQLYKELESLFGRKIDLLTKRSVLKSRNVYLRESVLSTRKVIYG